MSYVGAEVDWDQSISIKFSEQEPSQTTRLAHAFAFSEKVFQQGYYRQAEFILYQILKMKPSFAPAYAFYFAILQHQDRHLDQVGLCKRWIKESPRHIPAYMNLAQVLHHLLDQKGAIEATLAAMRIEPDNIKLKNHLGVLKKESGELAESLEIFNECIARDPDFNQAYWNRADLYKNISQGELEKMESRLANPYLTVDEKTYLYYALAHGFEYRHQYKKSFYYLSLGAKSKRSTIQYDHQREMRELESIIQCFNKDVMVNAQACANEDGVTPIFICGLPRSGTTLIEQIISSHPAVTGGEEIVDLSKAVANVLQSKSLNMAYPEWAGALTVEDWQQIGHNYLALTRRLQKTSHFTDKMPMNYKALGVVHLALPQAKIIHCTRHPMDNLLGCFKQLFGNGLRFTYDLDELADAYIGYHKVMDHWNSLFSGKILEVNYEALIGNQEAETRRLLDFLGLDWSDHCLDFHKNTRPVYSASSSQIRQPMFSSSIGQWRKYEAELSDLHHRLQIYLP